MSKDHSSYAKVPRRPLTSEEAAWVRELVLANPQWADVEITDLYVVAACTCGCCSVVLEEPSKPQNPKLVGHQGLVGKFFFPKQHYGNNARASFLVRSV
jgi:hypothetical protein